MATPQAFPFTGASVVEWLQRAVTVREVSGSNPGRDEHEILCGRRKPTDYVSFRRPVKIQQFHTLNTHDTMTRTTKQHSLQTPYTLELDLSPLPLDVAHSFPPE